MPVPLNVSFPQPRPRGRGRNFWVDMLRATKHHENTARSGSGHAALANRGLYHFLRMRVDGCNTAVFPRSSQTLGVFCNCKKKSPRAKWKHRGGAGSNEW